MRNLTALTVLIVISLEATTWLYCLRQCGHLSHSPKDAWEQRNRFTTLARRFYALEKGDPANSFLSHHLELTSNCSLPESSLRSSTSLTPTSDSALFFCLLNNLQKQNYYKSPARLSGGGGADVVWWRPRQLYHGARKIEVGSEMLKSHPGAVEAPARHSNVQLWPWQQEIRSTKVQRAHFKENKPKSECWKMDQSRVQESKEVPKKD